MERVFLQRKLDTPAVPISDDTIVEVTHQCEAKLMKMFNVVGDLDDEAPATPRSRGGFSRAESRATMSRPGTTEPHPAAEGGAAEDSQSWSYQLAAGRLRLLASTG